MKKYHGTGILFNLIIVMVVVGCSSPHYTEADLARLEAKEVQGIITVQSRGSFVLKDEYKEEKTYRTGQITEYIPADYRSQEGDKVRVSYREIWESSGRAKIAVLQLKALEIARKNKQLENPIEGEIVALGRGSFRHIKSILLKKPANETALPIYVGSLAKIEVDGEQKSADGFNFERLVGKKVSVIAEREPIVRGNAYIYVAKEIKMK